MTLQELFAGRSVDIDEVKARLKREAARLGLPFGERTKTYNTRLAQEFGKWAESEGRGEAYHDILFRAYFVEGVNIGKPAELIVLAESAGLSSNKARQVLQERSFRNMVDSDWRRSRDLGITAVPTFVLDGHALVGAQPYEKLEFFLTTHHVEKRV